MAKKPTKEENPTTDEPKAPSTDPIPDEAKAAEEAEGEFEPDMNAGEFNLEEEYKAPPLVPGGKYYGAVVKVSYKADDISILWEVALSDNGGMCSDGTTPVDGIRLFNRNMLPKPGDESELTKDGRMNKRQAKVNMLKKFADDMKIDMNSMAIIKAALQNQEWLGIPVIVDVTITEYEGRFMNNVKRIVRREE